MMSLGTKLTCYLLLGVLAVMGLDLYLSVQRIQTDLLHDVRREVAAISRTLHLALTLIDRTDSPGQYFTSFVASLSDFENVLDVVFYDHAAQIVARSTMLQEYQLPEVNIQQVITTQTPAEGLFRAGRIQRYYRVEPMVTRAGEGIAAMLVLEDFPFFTRVLRERIVVALGAALGLLAVLASIVAVVVRRSIAQPLRTNGFPPPVGMRLAASPTSLTVCASAWRPPPAPWKPRTKQNCASNATCASPSNWRLWGNSPHAWRMKSAPL